MLDSIFLVVVLIVLLTAYVELGDAAAAVDVYRLIQYDLAGVPFGSRLAALNHHAASFPFAPAADPSRSVALVRGVSSLLAHRATARGKNSNKKGHPGQISRSFSRLPPTPAPSRSPPHRSPPQSPPLPTHGRQSSCSRALCSIPPPPARVIALTKFKILAATAELRHLHPTENLGIPSSLPYLVNSVPQKVPQNFVFPLHQKQPLRNQQSNMHQKQIFPLPKNVPYMMHPSSSGHQNSLAYQTQKMQTDPLFNKQQLGLQSNISQLQQQRLVGPQSSVSNVQSRKRSMHMSQAKIEGEQKNQQPSLQSHKRSMYMSQAKIEGEQQNRQPSFTLFQSQDHQSQHQPPLQNLMPQTQSPQWLAMQKQNNPLQITEMQERSQASGSEVVAQSHNTMDQQNRSSQSQAGPPEVSSSDRVGANDLLQMHGSTSEKSPPSKGQSSNTDMLQ